MNRTMPAHGWRGATLMRERRWESRAKLEFGDVLAIGERLAGLGLEPAVPARDIICYIEEWLVEAPEDFDRLDPWATEDVTLVQIREAWRGDSFGPCQFEYNSSDAFEFLVPASRLAATYGGEAATVRAYLTGFSEAALEEFQAVAPRALSAYRCSAHCPLDELPEILQAIAPAGRLYATLCEFQTQHLLPDGAEAYAIVGILGRDGGFQIEVRLNRAPLPEDDMPGWLEKLIGLPVSYSPLPPFP